MSWLRAVPLRDGENCLSLVSSPHCWNASVMAGPGAAIAGCEVSGSRAQLTLTLQSLLRRHPLLGPSWAPPSQLLPSQAPSRLLLNRSSHICLHSRMQASKGGDFRPLRRLLAGVARRCWKLLECGNVQTRLRAGPCCARKREWRRCRHSALCALRPADRAAGVTQVSSSAGSHAQRQSRFLFPSLRSAESRGRHRARATLPRTSRTGRLLPPGARQWPSVGAGGRPSTGGDGCPGPEISGRPVA